jgi:hypothetical protein
VLSVLQDSATKVDIPASSFFPLDLEASSDALFDAKFKPPYRLMLEASSEETYVGFFRPDASYFPRSTSATILLTGSPRLLLQR